MEDYTAFSTTKEGPVIYLKYEKATNSLNFTVTLNENQDLIIILGKIDE